MFILPWARMPTNWIKSGILKDNFTMDEFMMWALYERNYLDYIVFGNKENKKCHGNRSK